jgi:putative transposase
MEELLEENIKIGFYTATIVNWKPLLRPDSHKEIVLRSLEFMVEKERAKIYGFVIMPNHIHLLWRILFPWKLKHVQRDFMKFTGQLIKFNLKNYCPDVLEKYFVGLKDREYQFWQRNSLNKLLDSREIVEQKLDYTHNNPVQDRWTLVKSPYDYKYSSIRFYEENDKGFGFLSHYMEVFE